ncbi:serine/threonine protein kinase [Streptomyces sp. CNZ748]|uniref:serine/threonine-protein kinase n=1 Tax=Streptomyces sp. CNZ748 TaxID=2885160 RepID=UPI0027E1AF1D|nr:serine/threonine protein kinase [Streptomyces sp. CNZ748]
MTGLTGSGAEPLRDDDPRRIGPIPLLGRLGAGGMGRVYLGVHEGGYAAVKQVLPSVAGEDQDFLRRFGHELDNLSRLPDEATAPLLAGDRNARPPWFATAYVPGITLREAVDLHGPLPREALWLLLREAADGLAAVHALDMVHRDLKPSNVMLTLDGLTLIDFGVARAADQSQLTRTGMVVGTPAYMSPEQASGKRESSGAVDVFALGSVIAYAASGRPPFGDESGHAVLYRIVHEEPDLGPLRELDSELADVVASCLDKDHEGRPTAAELAALASAHAPSGTPPWPAVVGDRLAERAAFAARTPHPRDLPPTVGPTEAAGEEGEEPAGEKKNGEKKNGAKKEEPPARKERRRRMLPVVVPVVVVVTGGTLAFQLLPYVTDSGNAAGGPTPSASVSVSADVTPSASAGSAKPSPSGSPSASKKSKDDDAEGREKDSDSRDTGAGAGAGAGSGEGGGTDAGGSDTRPGSGGGDTDTGGDGGGGSGSGGSDGGGGGGAPGGGGTLRNASSGRCLTGSGGQGYGNVSTGDCSSAAARWSLQGASGGTYRIVHASTGACLSAYGSMHMVGCGVDDAQEWRLGSGGTVVLQKTGRCLEHVPASGMLMVRVCSGADSQNWTRA